MKLFFISIIFSLTLVGDSLVKDGADIDRILQKIDTIAKTIREKELEEQKFSQEQIKMQETVQNTQPVMSEEEKLQIELNKMEQELNLKEKKLGLKQKEQEYYKRASDIKVRSYAYLNKKTNQLLYELRKKLYKLIKNKNMVINISKYMKIGNSEYAYISEKKFNLAKQKLLQIKKEIENTKQTMKRLKEAKELGPDKWFQVINTLDNGMQDEKDMRQMVADMPKNESFATSFGTKEHFIKVRTGENIDDIYVKKVNENSVILSFKEF
jgi:hypothetical protein